MTAWTPARRWIEVKVRKIVDEKDPGVLYLSCACGRVSPSPIRGIYVAPDCNHRRDPCQSLHHRRSADISGVQNLTDARKRIQRLLTHEAVSVRNHADCCGHGFR
jgi:hypothetical protein